MLFGAGVMALGLILKPRRREVLYSQMLDDGQGVTVRVVRNGRVVASG